MSKFKAHLFGIFLITLALAGLFYIGPGNHVTGLLSAIDIAPGDFSYNEVNQNISLEEALGEIEDAEAKISALEDLNLRTSFVRDALAEARGALDIGDFQSVAQLTALIEFIGEKDIEYRDRIALLEKRRDSLQGDGVDTNQADILISAAKEAFENEQFDETENLLAQSEDALEAARLENTRVGALVTLGKNFFVRYWWQISLVVFLFILVTIPLVKKIRKKKLQHKIKRLKEELQKTKELIKGLQRACFVDKKISTDTYKAKVKHYEERIAELKHTIPVVKAQIEGKKYQGKRGKQEGVLKVE